MCNFPQEALRSSLSTFSKLEQRGTLIRGLRDIKFKTSSQSNARASVWPELYEGGKRRPASRLDVNKQLLL